MINFSKTTLLIILLIAFGILAGTSAYQWWQTKGELAKQIEENENLTKQVDELQTEIDRLQKEIIKLKAPEEEKKEIIEEEVTGWKTYRSEKQGFEIRYPAEWDYAVSLDKKRNDYYIFQGGFGDKDVGVGVRINLFDSVSLPFPGRPICSSEEEFIIFEKNKLQKYIGSTTLKELQDSECDMSLVDGHLVHGEFCVNKELEVEPPKEGGYTQAELYCENKGNLYVFDLVCQGEEWQGKEGRDKCSTLFDQILSTFRIIEK